MGIYRVLLLIGLLFSSGAFTDVPKDCALWLKNLPQELHSQYSDVEALYARALALAGEASERPVLSIVIPAYKEEKRLPSSISQLQSFFKEFPFPVEVLIRVEQSPDQTVAAASLAKGDDATITVFDHPVKRGKGYAVRQGMLEAQGDYVLFMDADLSTPLPEIFRFLAHAAALRDKGIQKDIFICDRRNPKSTILAKQTPFRQLSGKVFSKITTATVGAFGIKGVYDTQCGFKMFSRAAAQEVFSQAEVDGFAFDVEVLLLAHRFGYQIEPIPVSWKDDERSTVHPLKDPPKMLYDLLKIQRQISRRFPLIKTINDPFGGPHG